MLDEETAKFLSKVLVSMPKINSGVMEWWYKNPKFLKKKLRDLLYPPFRIWKTIDLKPNPKKEEDFFYNIMGKIKTEENNLNLLKKLTPISHCLIGTVDLVIVSPKYLGFEGMTKLSKILDKAKELGLFFCPSAIVYLLCIQLKEISTEKKQLVIITEPVIDIFIDAKPKIFAMKKDDSNSSKIELITYFAEEDSFWYDYWNLVFWFPPPMLDDPRN